MSRCRSCGHAPIETVLSLGDMPLANALLTEEQLSEPEATYPLDLAFCPQCALVQITETVPPETLFRDYPYLSSFSQTVVDNGRENAELMMATRELDSSSLVMEIGSNDGYLLQFYVAKGVPVLGIDPAANIRQAAEDRGVRTLCAYFGLELARELEFEGLLADVIHANNVFAHVADLNGLVAGMALVLEPEGVIEIQVPYVLDLIEHTEFDTIYHEHLCYFSVTALDALFCRHGLMLQHVEHLPIHGGTLRLFVMHAGAEDVAGSVHDMLKAESRAGACQLDFYQDFGERVEELRTELCALLAEIKADGQAIVGYAASAKGTTLLNYCGIGPETLEYVVDRSTVKQGRYTPGTHLRIEPPERIAETKPDYALLLAWNHADEILERERVFRARGGKFIVPIPGPRVI